MKPSLVLKMGQQLTMTPQLQQAIRLLQLSTLDLQQEIQEALESNLMLEREEDGDDFDNHDPLADGAESATPASASSQDTSAQDSADNTERFEEGEWNERIPSELPVDTAWEDIYQTSASSLPSNDDEEWDFTARTSAGESLQSHLLWQPNLTQETVEVRVPFGNIAIVQTAGFDGVTAGLRVNESAHSPLLCVANVFKVASGDLSLPGRVNQ